MISLAIFAWSHYDSHSKETCSTMLGAQGKRRLSTLGIQRGRTVACPLPDPGRALAPLRSPGHRAPCTHGAGTFAVVIAELI